MFLIFYEFTPPEKWKNDFNNIVEGKISEVSEDYKNYLKEFYPLLAEKGVMDLLFKKSEEVSEGA